MRNTAALALLSFAALTALAAPHAQSAQPPTFRAAADVVEVDVIVHDKNGRFVGDLTAHDFSVREEGTTQQIDLFYIVNGNTRVSVAGAGDNPRAASDDRAAPTRIAPRIFIAFF